MEEPGKMELRLVYDCENLKQILQSRYVFASNVATPWTDVPVVYAPVDNR